MSHIIAIIPARGGSKGLPRKNLLDLGGKPLIAYSIEDAKEANLVDRVYVSTEDLEIAEVSRQYGAEIIHRPPKLASDTATSTSVLIHALSEIERTEVSPKLIVLIQCTSPIRTGEDIDQAIEQIQTNSADSLLSVSPSHKFLWEQVDGVAKPINYDYRHRPRRQDMSSQFVENGSIYIFKPWVLKKTGNFLGGIISLFIMKKHNIDIDSWMDFQIANQILMSAH